MSFEIATGYKRRYLSLPADKEVTITTSKNYYSTPVIGGPDKVYKYNTSSGGGFYFDLKSTTITNLHKFQRFIRASHTSALYAIGPGPNLPDSFGNTSRFGGRPTSYMSKFNESTNSWELLTFPVAIIPTGGACNFDGSIILIYGVTSSDLPKIFRSIDYGVGWSDITATVGLDNLWHRGGSITYYRNDSNNSDTFLISTARNADSDGMISVFRSFNGGVSWTASASAGVTTTIANVTGFPGHQAGTTNGDAICFDVNGTTYIVTTTAGGLRWTTDFGNNWKEFSFSQKWPTAVGVRLRQIAYGGGKLVVVHNGDLNQGPQQPLIFWCDDINNINDGNFWYYGRGTGGAYSVDAPSFSIAYYTDDNGSSGFLHCSEYGNINKITLSSSGISVFAPAQYYNNSYYTPGTTNNGTVARTVGPDIQTFLLGQQLTATQVDAYGNRPITISGVNNYPNDTPRSNGSNTVTGWTKAFLGSPSLDDAFIDVSIPIGFTWGWGGNNYTSWKLNTNGMMQFNNFNGLITPSNASTGIAAHSQDLYFIANNTLSTSRVSSFVSGREVLPGSPPASTAMSALSNLGISYSRVNSSTLRIQSGTAPNGGNAGIVYVNQVKLIGFIAVENGTTKSINFAYPREMKLIPNVNYYDVVFDGILDVYNLTHLVLETYASTPPPEISGADTGSSVWYCNASWTEDGVAHYVYQTIVYCFRYDFREAPGHYKITLYKHGANQKFTVRLLENTLTNLAPKNNGPWPMADLNNQLRTYSSFVDQTWYSSDNGSSWSLSDRNNKADSTVVQMGSPYTISQTSNGLSLKTLYERLNPYRINAYAPTSSVIPTQPDYATTLGTGLIRAMIRFVASHQPEDDVEQYLFDFIFNGQYAVSSGGKWSSTTYYRYGDIARTGQIDYFTVQEMQSLYTNGNAIDSDSQNGLSLLLSQIINSSATFTVNGVTETFYDAAVRKNYMFAVRHSLGQIYSSTLPGVVNVPISMSNIGVSTFNGVGPVDNNTDRYAQNLYKYVFVSDNANSGVLKNAAYSEITQYSNYARLWKNAK